MMSIFALIYVLSSAHVVGLNIDKKIATYNLGNARIGITVIDISADSTVFDYFGKYLCTPASVQKLITTSVALQKLGESYRLPTYFSYKGEVKSGVLLGNLIVKGTGDASFQSKYFSDPMNSFSAIANEIKRFGITKIQGDIVLDVSNFENQPEVASWIWEDMGNYYGSPVYPLNFNDNMLKFQFNSGNAGDATSINNKNIPSDLIIENKVTAYNGNSDLAYIYSMPYSNKIIARGKIPSNRSNFVVKASMPNVLKYYGESIKNVFEVTGGVVISEKEVVADSLIYTYYSPKLSEIVKFTNQNSVNLFAEQLLKHLGYKHAGIGSTKNGLKVIENIFTQWGIHTKVLLHDGSGLSPFNAISAQAIANVITRAVKSEYSETFVKSLSTPGHTGTLSNFATGKVWSGKLQGKTGTLTNVRSLAGLLEAKSGKKYSFCIIVNNYTAASSDVKRFFEDFLDELYRMY